MSESAPGWYRCNGVPIESAPWIMEREGGELTLLVQPWYGDGINYKGIIRTEQWTVTLHERFSSLEKAQQATMVWCWKYLQHIYKDDLIDDVG